MTIYVIFIFVYLFLAIIDEKVKFKICKNERKNNLLRLIILLLPLLVTVAFRSISVGNDTATYKYLFEKYCSMWYRNALTSTSKEVGFVTLCYIAGKLGLNYYGFQIFIAVITYFALGRYLLKHSNNYALSILIFMCTLGYFRSMNISREIMAAMFALNIIDLVIKGKKVRFTIGVLIISLFHRTSLVLLVLLFFDFIKKLNLFRKALVFLACAVAYASADKILQMIIRLTGRYEYLLKSKYFTNNGYLAMLMWIIFTLLFIALETQRKNALKAELSTTSSAAPSDFSALAYHIRRSECVIYCYSFCFIFGFMGFNFGLADRAVIYFSMLFMESITIKNDKNIKVLLKVGAIVILIAFYIAVMLLRNNWQGTIPYSTFN